MKKCIDYCKNFGKTTAYIFKENKKNILADAAFGAFAFGLFSIGNLAVGYAKAYETMSKEN